MSWMAVNNAPLLGTGATDISGLSNQFRDGQKLRQEYEARQQTKALNEIMKVGDHNGRLELAQQHKYAGALVPLIQKQEQDRLIAEQTYNQGQANIKKTNSEVGKLSAEERGQNVKNVLDGNNVLANASAGLSKPLLFNTIGQLFKAGVYDENTTQGLLKLANSDDPNDQSKLKQIAMSNPDLAKLYQPTTQITDTGDKKIYQTVDGFTGKYSEPYQQVTLGETANNFGTRTSGERNNIRTTNASVANNQNTVAAGERNNIRTTDATIYGTESRAATADQQTAVNWYKAQTGAAVAQQNANTAATKANKTGVAGGGKPRPVAATKEMNKHLTNIKNNAHTIRSTTSWIERIQNGDLNLGALSNSLNTAANRTGVNSLGSNPAAYAEFKANMTKLASDALRLNSGVQTDMDYKRALEEMQAGTYIPRNNQTAVALLTKIRNDFNVKTASEYASYADYKREYDGVTLPEYGKSPRSQKGKTSKNKPTKTSAGQAIGDKVFGGG